MTEMCSGVSNGPGIRFAEFTYVYANTYATGGGDPCDLTGTFKNEVIAVILPNLDDTRTYIPVFDKANKKMLAYKQKSDDTFEEAAAADLHTITFKFIAIGR
jgi:hypothetical protein